MTDSTAHKNLRCKQIWRIITVGIALTGTGFILGILVSCDSRQPDPTPPPIPPSIITPDKPQTQLQTCKLFFFDTNSLRLVIEERELDLSLDLTKRLKQTITELLGDSRSGLYQTIPKGTLLYEVYIDDVKTAYLDFSHHLKDEHIRGTTSEALTVGVILRTVKANFPDQIRKVQILIEGLETDTLGGHIDISKPLNVSLELEVVSRQIELTEDELLEDALPEAEPTESESTNAKFVEEETLEANETSGQQTDQ